MKMIRILCILKILRYIYAYKWKKTSICQNDQNFMNIKYINIYMYIYKKSSIYQNDQNFINIKYINVYICI